MNSKMLKSQFFNHHSQNLINPIIKSNYLYEFNLNLSLFLFM